MGFIQAFKGAIGGTFADQWTDFLTVPAGLAPTAALFRAVPRGQNSGRGSNTRGSDAIISNGSKIVVHPGYGLITMEDGRTTGLVTEAGGYEWRSDDPNSRSIFAGDNILASTLGTSWERFKFGGQPGTQQLAFFVNLKELPNNRFGTQSEIYWDDVYMNAQVGAVARGTYTMRIVDPLLFVHNWVPASYLTDSGAPFDFTDMDNDAAGQLFQEVVSSLAPAFSKYTNDPDKSNRITRIQSDSMGLAASLSAVAEENYRWTTDRGLVIEKVAIASIEYDENTRKLLKDVQAADALSGNRNQSFVNQAVARGVQAAGESGGGGTGLAMMGMGAGAVGGMIQPSQQSTPAGQPQQGQPQAQPSGADGGQPQNSGDDLTAKLQQYKSMLDQGLITPEDYEAAKKKALGL